MAKPMNQNHGQTDSTAIAVDPSVHDVARQLFAAVWRPRNPIAADVIAVECYAGAEAFCRIASRITAGATVAEIEQERKTTTTP